MKRLAVALALLATALLCGCVDGGVPFERQLAEEAATSPSDGFRLSQVDGLTEDQFLVVCPYDSQSSVEERLGFAWKGAPNTSNDAEQYLALVHDGRVSRALTLNRSTIDFCSSDRDWILLHAHAVLDVTKRGNVFIIEPPA